VIASPAVELPAFSLSTVSKLALTNDWFTDKWTFVAFTFGHCLPNCQSLLDAMKSLKSSLANNDVQFLVIGIDSEHESVTQLNDFLIAHSIEATAVTSEQPELIEQLAHHFVALYLQTDYSDGSYMIEQEHHLFLVDPKGRLYATFKPPFENINSDFFELRRFYAQSE
jgi:cytochrome oxidase Cu insertion factor (SCO1/SenC/PrrC family)